MIGPKPPKLSKAELSAMEAYARATVNGRDEGRCVRCRLWGGLDWDHRKNRSQGGLWRPSNGQMLCRACHMWKGENVALAAAQGFSVPGSEEPADWPATRYLLTPLNTLRPILVLYDDRGQYQQITQQQALRLSYGIVTGILA